MKNIKIKNLFLTLFILPAVALAQPANNEPCTATELFPSQTCTVVNFSMAGATYNPAYPASTGTCPPANSNLTPGDVWFGLTIPANGVITITMDIQPGSTNTDGVLQAYTSVDCTNLTYIGCSDDEGPGTMPMLTLTNLTPGNFLYLKVFQYLATGVGNYTICVDNILPLELVHKVGIGLTAPDSTLDVNGNLLVRGGMRIAGGLKLSAGTPGAGKVLTSDAAGAATWQVIPSQLPLGTANQTLRHNGTTFAASGALLNDGTNITVANQLKIQGGAPGNGKVLTSDAAGLATWQQTNSAVVATKATSQNVQLRTPTYEKSESFVTEQVDDLNQFNDSIFTAAAAGTYLVNIRLEIGKLSATLTVPEPIEIRIVSSLGVLYRYSYTNYPADFALAHTISMTAVYKMNAGQILKFQVARTSSGTNFETRSGAGSELSIVRLY